MKRERREMIYYSDNRDKIKSRCIVLTVLILYPLGLEYGCLFYHKKIVCIETKPFIEFSELPKSEMLQITNLSAQVSTVTASGTSGYTSTTTTI